MMEILMVMMDVLLYVFNNLVGHVQKDCLVMKIVLIP